MTKLMGNKKKDVNKAVNRLSKAVDEEFGLDHTTPQGEEKAFLDEATMLLNEMGIELPEDLDLIAYPGKVRVWRVGPFVLKWRVDVPSWKEFLFRASTVEIEEPMLSDSLHIGEKIYYPANNGIAMICQVMKKNKQDVLVQILKTVHTEDGEIRHEDTGRKWFVPRENIDQHAIRLDDQRSSAYASQILLDPDNSIVYLRYVWTESIVDRLYNWWCRVVKKRKDQTWAKKD